MDASIHCVVVHGMEGEQAVNALHVYGAVEVWQQPDKRLIHIVVCPYGRYVVVTAPDGECVTAFTMDKSWASMHDWIHAKKAKRIK